MARKYFQFKGTRYDIGTKLTVQLPDGEQKKTTYFGYGHFEDIADGTQITIVSIDSPKYFIETYTK